MFCINLFSNLCLYFVPLHMSTYNKDIIIIIIRLLKSGEQVNAFVQLLNCFHCLHFVIIITRVLYYYIVCNGVCKIGCTTGVTKNINKYN